MEIALLGAALVWIVWRTIRRFRRASAGAVQPTPALDHSGQGPRLELVIRRTINDEPRQREAVLPEYDNWETDYLIGAKGEFNVEVRAEISYVDGAGQRSHRIIRTRSVVPWANDLAILAYCEMRNAHRTFLMSRITEFIDLSTGEIVSNVARYLRDIYEQSPRGQLDAIVAEMDCDLIVLSFLARADGRLMPKERQSILNYFNKAHPDASIDGADLKDTLSIIDPTSRQYRAALRTARGFPPERRSALLEAVEDMGSARAKIDALTEAAVKLAREQLAETKPDRGKDS
ncbi:MAG: hypothetical protein ACK4MV_16320 [Beijerinckiaceae bacterium]